jgi:AcrR family transcriptional regulator
MVERIAHDEPGDPRDPRAAKSRIAMLEAARSLLAAEGWDAITHARVAATAGVGRATAYRHWSTVNEMALEAASMEIESVSTQLTGHLRTDLVAELVSLRTSLVDRGVKRLMVLVMERAIHDAEFRAIRHQLNERGGASLRNLLQEAVGRGDLAPDVDLEELASELVGPIIYEVVLHDKTVSDERLVRLVDSVLRGIRSL